MNKKRTKKNPKKVKSTASFGMLGLWQLVGIGWAPETSHLSTGLYFGTILVSI